MKEEGFICVCGNMFVHVSCSEQCRCALPACDVTASIWDPYFVHPWPKTPSRTNYSGNTEAATCQPRACRRALSSTICGRRRRGSSPVIRVLFTTDVWGHARGHTSEQINTYAFPRGVVLRRRPSPQTDEPVKQRGARRGVGTGSCALQTRFSNHTVSEQTGDVSSWNSHFHLAKPLSPCWCTSSSWNCTTALHTESFFIRQSQMNHFFFTCCLFIHVK